VSRMTRIVLVLFLGLGASALVSWCVYRFAFLPAQAREDAFAAIEVGQVSAGADGIATLPAKWAVASMDGKAYVTRGAQGSLWVLFLKERGAGAKLHGYLFSNKPSSAAATGSVEIDFAVPAGPGGVPPARSRVTVRVMRVAGPSSYEVINETP
jgi:hypothetical protein